VPASIFNLLTKLCDINHYIITHKLLLLLNSVIGIVITEHFLVIKLVVSDQTVIVP
jgi:hypothetical protein